MEEKVLLGNKFGIFFLFFLFVGFILEWGVEMRRIGCGDDMRELGGG